MAASDYAIEERIIVHNNMSGESIEIGDNGNGDDGVHEIVIRTNLDNPVTLIVDHDHLKALHSAITKRLDLFC